jgi:hypothetical protein
MKITDLPDVIQQDTSLSVLTKETLLHFVERLMSKMNVIMINDDIFEIYLHMNEIEAFFIDDLQDVDIMCNVIFDIPSARVYLATRISDIDIDEESDIQSTVVLNEEGDNDSDYPIDLIEYDFISDTLTVIKIVVITNLMISTISLLFSLVK